MQQLKIFISSMLAVFASFFGVRSRKNFDQDIKKLNPFHLMLAGFIGVFLFVGALILVVRWVVST